MKYIEQNLGTEERILAIAKPHPINFIGPGILLFLGFILTIFFIGIFIVALCVIGIFRIIKAEYALTNERVIKKTGIFGVNASSIKLGKIESVEIRQGLFGRIFKYADVEVRGTGVGVTRFPAIENPTEFKNAIESNLK